ncbi:hypothetical protein UlMin_022958 [Ulmus minor]
MLPSTVFTFLWSLALLTQVSQSLLYILICLIHFKMIKAEFLHHVGVNYLFAPWISWLLLLQSSPFIFPNTIFNCQLLETWRRLWPVTLIGWKESAVCMFSLGMVYYLVLFVALYQRVLGYNSLPAMLRPMFFLFIGAPSMASLAWDSISGKFDFASKCSSSSHSSFSKECIPACLVRFIFTALVVLVFFNRIIVLALAATKYAEEVKDEIAQGIMPNSISSLCSGVNPEKFVPLKL